jgi:hypothetical protein
MAARCVVAAHKYDTCTCCDVHCAADEYRGLHASRVVFYIQRINCFLVRLAELKDNIHHLQ